MLFPLAFRPQESYHERPRSFGAPRKGGQRSHAGCDLYAPVGTPVRAVADGTVLNFYLFYLDTYALEVDHGDFLVRYGEIGSDPAPGVRVGERVEAGQVLGTVGRLRGLAVSMLHFEMYEGTATGALTRRDRPPFQRRVDLMDPTPHLDAAALAPARMVGPLIAGLAAGAATGAVVGALAGAVAGTGTPAPTGTGTATLDEETARAEARMRGA